MDAGFRSGSLRAGQHGEGEEHAEPEGQGTFGENTTATA